MFRRRQFTPTTDAGIRTSTAQGLSHLVSGQMYGFHCRLYPNMKGLLIAV
ncbi:MAG: hypothetical protein NVSMB57_14330 [Actinomycetota bacterium]